MTDSPYCMPADDEDLNWWELLAEEHIEQPVSAPAFAEPLNDTAAASQVSTESAASPRVSLASAPSLQESLVTPQVSAPAPQISEAETAAAAAPAAAPLPPVSPALPLDEVILELAAALKVAAICENAFCQFFIFVL